MLQTDLCCIAKMMLQFFPFGSTLEVIKDLVECFYGRQDPRNPACLFAMTTGEPKYFMV